VIGVAHGYSLRPFAGKKAHEILLLLADEMMETLTGWEMIAVEQQRRRLLEDASVVAKRES
jgi:hypothetical protein